MPRGQTLALALALWLSASDPVHSGDLRLEPVSLTLRQHEDSTSLWLSNTGHQPLLAQVRLYAWTQHDGGEVLAPTRELAVSPPLLEVPPLGRQRIRVVRLGNGVPATEAAYRLVVDELPPVAALAPTTDRPTVLRYSIPVFQPPAVAGGSARLSARIEADTRGGHRLRLDNHGDRHARIAALAFVADGGRRHVLAPNLAGYVLAGRYKYWPLTGSASQPTPGHFEAQVDGAPMVLVPEPNLTPLDGPAGEPTGLGTQAR